MYISLKPGFVDHGKAAADVTAALRQIIGPIARPAHVWVTDDLPKTRSGKIMRRVIASISNFMDVGDTTTLANPEVVEEIRVQVQTVKVREGEVPEGLSPEMAEEIRRFGDEG